MKSRRIGIALIAAAFLAVSTGCADMKDQPRFEPYEQSDFFPDGRASRELVDGTVPRGFLREDDAYYRGLTDDGTFVERIPAAVDAAMLERGRERYDIFCSPCHSMTGDGNGMIVQRGYKQASSYHQPRLRAIEDGYLYDVITNGFGQMAGYASQIDPEDRWAIVAYIRALQLAQFTDVATVEPDIRSVLERGEVYDVRSLEKKDEGDDHGAAH
ncbi:MAG TPA: cytochrome c [Candidatus Krumholzibacteria bacterium]|nr:cytochrome c [Candidatus Krumholzibacteria bacterium]